MIGSSELALFEKRYLSLEATTLDDFRDWVSGRHADIQVTLREKSVDGAVVKVSRAAFDDISLVLYRYSQSIISEFSEAYDAYFVCVPISGTSKRVLPGVGEIVQGPDQILVYKRCQGMQSASSPDYTNLSLVVPATVLEQSLQSDASSRGTGSLFFTPLVDTHSGAGRAVISLANYILAQFSSLPSPFNNTMSNASLTSYLSSILLNSLPHNYTEVLDNGQHTPVPRTVKKAEEYMREACAEVATVEQIARVAGCSPRALHSAFKTFKGKTPMAMLNELKLEAAHKDLLHEDVTVCEVAAKFGFSNQGRFARQYAQKYGQKPSQTQRLGRVG